MKPKSPVLLFVILLLLCSKSFSQSLSSERVAKIKSATVRITIENDGHHGSGFFVGANGMICTCWHVIEPAMIRNPTTNAVIGMKRLFATTNNGDKIELGIQIKIIQDTSSGQTHLKFQDIE
jgi:hypothetical protein